MVWIKLFSKIFKKRKNKYKVKKLYFVLSPKQLLEFFRIGNILENLRISSQLNLFTILKIQR